METGQSFPGVMQAMAVSVRQFEISSKVCSRFKPQVRPLLQFWKTDPCLPGVMQVMAVTVRQFETSSNVEDGSVFTWGHAGYGGDSSEVRDQRKCGRRIRVYLGSCRFSSAVRDQLKGVQQIQATPTAFAAILEDGSVVTWGHAGHGGDIGSSRSAQGCAADSSHI